LTVIIKSMSRPSYLSWGLLSTARINRAVIGPIKTSKYSHLSAVASRSIEKSREYAKAWGIPQSYGSYEALLADPKIDVVYISLPNSLHTEWSIKALEKGKHVLCEKPLTTSVADVERIKGTALKTGRVITEAFMYRHHPQTKIVKQMIDRGEIGKLQLIHGSFCYTNTRADNPRLDPTLGGGSLWDVGCYPIGYARYLTGEEPIEVYGRQVSSEKGIDLLFAGQLNFSGGIIAQIDCSFISPSKSLIEITGENGRIIIPAPYKPGNKSIIYLERNGKTHAIKIKGGELYHGEIEDIENAIMHGKPPLISLDDSRGNIATIEALYRSSQILKSITLAELQTRPLEREK
jgi:xylose dehydrogenase (NAD/NADP)